MIADFISKSELRKTWSAGEEVKTTMAWDPRTKVWLIQEEGMEVKRSKQRWYEIKSTPKIERLLLTCTTQVDSEPEAILLKR